MRNPRNLFPLAVSILVVATAAFAQQAKISDAAYMKQALSAAPPAVSAGAAVMRMDKDGSMRTLRPGTNGFTCLILDTNKMCGDANSMEFMHAVISKTAPPEKTGLAYMLQGDKGASNTDPYATAKTADNHWIVTGPHIMIFGLGAKSMGLTEDKDPDPGKPYLMWAGTPYEHAMIPVAKK